MKPSSLSLKIALCVAPLFPIAICSMIWPPIAPFFFLFGAMFGYPVAALIFGPLYALLQGCTEMSCMKCVTLGAASSAVPMIAWNIHGPMSVLKENALSMAAFGAVAGAGFWICLWATERGALCIRALFARYCSRANRVIQT